MLKLWLGVTGFPKGGFLAGGYVAGKAFGLKTLQVGAAGAAEFIGSAGTAATGIATVIDARAEILVEDSADRGSLTMFYGLLFAGLALAMFVWTPKTGKGIVVYCGRVIGMWMIYLVVKHFS